VQHRPVTGFGQRSEYEFLCADIIDQIEHYRLQEQGKVIPKYQKDDLRTYGIGAQILKSIGVKKMKVMSSPKKFHGLSGFGLEVVEYFTGE